MQFCKGVVDSKIKRIEALRSEISGLSEQKNEVLKLVEQKEQLKKDVLSLKCRQEETQMELDVLNGEVFMKEKSRDILQGEVQELTQERDKAKQETAAARASLQELTRNKENVKTWKWAYQELLHIIQPVLDAITRLAHYNGRGGMFTAFAVKRPQVLFDIADAPENCEVLIDSCVASELPSDAVVLLTEEICLAVSRDNPLSSRSLIPVQRLRSELFIDLTGSDSYREFFRQIFAGGPMPLTCARTVSYQLMKEFAALDMGVALAASVNWNGSGAPANVKLVSIEGRPCRYIYLQERGKYRPECLTEFVDFLKDSFTAMQIKHPVRK